MAAHNARRGCGLNAFHAIGVGNNHALDIFNDIVADTDFYHIRRTAQNLPRFGGCVGNGNRLGAAHCRNKFRFQNL